MAHRVHRYSVDLRPDLPVEYILKEMIQAAVCFGFGREEFLVQFDMEHPAHMIIRYFSLFIRIFVRLQHLHLVFRKYFRTPVELIFWDEDVLVSRAPVVRLAVEIPADDAFHHQRGQPLFCKSGIDLQKFFRLSALYSDLSDHLCLDHPHKLLRAGRKCRACVNCIIYHRKDLVISAEPEQPRPAVCIHAVRPCHLLILQKAAERFQHSTAYLTQFHM